MSVRIVAVEPDGVVRMAASGSLTASEIGPSQPNAFARLVGDGWASNRLVLDLGAVDYLDSCAVGWLLSSVKALGQSGGKLTLCNAAASVRDVLQLMKIDRVIEIAENEPAALSLVREGA